MIEHFDVIQSNKLFEGLSANSIGQMLDCLCVRYASYSRGETAIWEGDAVSEIGIVLSGRARSVKTGACGKVFILSVLEPGSFVGVLLAASRSRKSPVSVQAELDLSVLFIPFHRVVGRCAQSCERHDIFLRNCFDAIAEQSLTLHDRIDCLIRPSVREKITAYLNRVSREKGTRSFLIPMNRAAMADYINVDRSALSRELSKMRDEGLIDYYKSSFKLL